MKLVLKTDFKSLKPFEIELTNSLTVITGLNGSGKTHLLKGMQAGNIQVFDDNEQTQIPSFKIKYAEYSSLTPNQAHTINNEINNKVIDQIFPLYQNYQNAFKTNPNIHLLAHLSNNVNNERLIKKISEISDKPIQQLTKSDFHHYFPIDAEPNTDVLYQSFSLIIKRYWDKYIDNQTRQWMSSKGHRLEYFDDRRFVQKYGQAPWNLINTILQKAQLDCRVDAPDFTQREVPYILKLTNIHTQAKIDFHDLSGGEKVLMSLAIIMYNANLEREFPKIILLDEGDATLNPSMSKHYLDVLNEVFIRQKKVKVILATHSLSTVSFAPENSLYVMRKVSINPRLVKTTKEEAIKALSIGVKSFYINYEKRRQIFVESKYDATFYTKIYNWLKAMLDTDVPLHFFASGEGNKNADCEEVKRLVKQLSEAGNPHIFGLIDWDKKNDVMPHANIKVIGKNKRYSIENYVFDPLFVAAFLERERLCDKLELGFQENENYYSISKMASPQIQILVNKIVEKVKNNSNLTSLDEKMITVQCVNNIRYNIPTWYLHHVGHALEVLLKNTFPQLNRFSKTPGDFALKNEFLIRVIADLQGFISKDFLDVFQEIQR